MKKKIKFIAVILSVVVLGTACGKKADVTTGGDFDIQKEITIISREDGSGTRGAFVELFDILEKKADGTKEDITIDTADITQSTGVVISKVESDKYAIGYISIGSLKDTIKALNIDGAVATTESIKNGDYQVYRPFNIATKGELSEEAGDFINFIMSEQGQKIVEEAGCISSENRGEFKSTRPQGKVTVAGSSSVTPVMEKLKEAYEVINPDVTIEISQSDSTNGITSVLDGISDIGMASREIKDSELESGIESTVIALDGIAIIVNNANELENLTSEQVKEIYTGQIINWNQCVE
jgi:ABC-type phosphate transport system, periplasmic component